MQATAFLQGVVLSAKKMQKSVMVGVSYRKYIPVYKKTILQMSKIMVHDEKQECNVGDQVVIKQSRPYSKRKHHEIHQILKKDEAAQYLLQNLQIKNSVKIQPPSYESTKPGFTESLD